jgi:hypothetical protein
MADQDEVVFRQRVCRGCNAVFCICCSCDRGHRYCSPECRVLALREQRRRANRRHQHSPEGRLDHRDRQREYRKRCAQRRVTDKSSSEITTSGNMPSWNFGSAQTTARIGSTAPSVRFRVLLSWHQPSQDHRPPLLCCVACGQSYRFVDPFPPFQPIGAELR